MGINGRKPEICKIAGWHIIRNLNVVGKKNILMAPIVISLCNLCLWVKTPKNKHLHQNTLLKSHILYCIIHIVCFLSSTEFNISKILKFDFPWKVSGNFTPLCYPTSHGKFLKRFWQFPRIFLPFATLEITGGIKYEEHHTYIVTSFYMSTLGQITTNNITTKSTEAWPVPFSPSPTNLSCCPTSHLLFIFTCDA